MADHTFKLSDELSRRIAELAGDLQAEAQDHRDAFDDRSEKWQEGEKELFWIYDDLHIPNPVSPLFFDIGGWWLTCDHMFRRFATPFACDWIAKNINGYVYTAAVPCDPNLHSEATEYQSRYGNSSQSRVSELQQRLSRAGYYHGSIDGVLGPQTRRAIRAYEQDHDNAG